MNNLLQEDTICARATGGGLSAIAVIRLSGNRQLKLPILFLVGIF